MLMKVVSLLLVVLMINVTGVITAFAGDPDSAKLGKREAKIKKHAAKVEKGIRKLGVGKGSIVKVKLRNKKKVKGYIGRIDKDSFTVIDKTGKATVVGYPDARQVKGNNLSKGAWIAIGAGLAMAVFGLVVLIIVSKN